ncbi:hypothetical protein [Roseibium sp. Sym1]|uniref:hypothetical protein n=1 Tax=Roseibium sp. Sym1 TaxID=3016006 RepID=UPI0022B59BF7|nr:hypothetical protein [Roseibium sp. Sym1]
MNFNNTYAIAALVAGGILLVTTMTSTESPRTESNLGDCRGTAAFRCDDETISFPDSCDGENTIRCNDGRKTIIVRVRNSTAWERFIA